MADMRVGGGDGGGVEVGMIGTGDAIITIIVDVTATAATTNVDQLFGQLRLPVVVIGIVAP